jgi:hypothetical protein
MRKPCGPFLEIVQPGTTDTQSLILFRDVGLTWNRLLPCGGDHRRSDNAAGEFRGALVDFVFGKMLGEGVGVGVIFDQIWCESVEFSVVLGLCKFDDLFSVVRSGVEFLLCFEKECVDVGT